MHRVEEAAYFASTLQAKTLIPSAGCVSDAHVAVGANLDALKMRRLRNYHASKVGTAASETIPLGRVRGVGTVLAVSVGSIAINSGAATVTVDILKNGTTVLTAVVTLNNANTARVFVAGTLSGTPTLAIGDFLEAVVVATAGGGTVATGLSIDVITHEDPQ
jgi:hypothetical protein